MGGACEKTPNKPNDTGAMTALDHAGSGSAAKGADGELAHRAPSDDRGAARPANQVATAGSSPS